MPPATATILPRFDNRLERLRASVDLVRTRQRLETSAPASAVELAARAGFTPDPWQRDLLLSAAPQMLLRCSRQSGKSTVAALIALYEALYRAPALVLVLSPGLRQSQELYRKVRDAYQALGGEVLQPSEESALRAQWPNGSRIICLPGREDATIRGYSGVRLLLVDEAARVADDLYQAIRPMLAVSQGRLIALSTPFGARGWFHHEWEHGEDWERVKITAYDCPRIPRDWLEAERATIGDWWFRQEYLVEWVDRLTQVFSTEHVMAALDARIQPLFGRNRGTLVHAGS